MRGGRVVVTGLGAVTPLGVGVETFWDRAVRGEVATRPVRRFDASAYRGDLAGEVELPGPAAATSGSEVALSTAFALVAGQEAVEDAGLSPDLGPRTALYLGSVFGTRPDLEGHGLGPGAIVSDQVRSIRSIRALDEICAVVSDRFGISGPVAQLSMACASGNAALVAGVQAIRRGIVDVALVGGVEQLAESMFMMFSSMRAMAPDAVRPFDRGRRGMVLAEGAAVLVLERADHARARGARSYCEVVAATNVCEAHDMVGPEPSGEGAVRAMRAVLDAADEAPEAVDCVVAHGTGTPANDEAEARAVTTVFERSPLVTAPKSMLGHLQGAAGAVGAIAGVLAIRDGVVPPTPTSVDVDPDLGVDVRTEAVVRPVRVVVNNAYGFGGNVSSVLLRGVA
jgi:3-oxoacyl-[acyl-carrier-protein] synthase II